MESNLDADLMTGLDYKIKKITVISGNILDIHLWHGNRRFLGYLDVQTTPEAAKGIVELLNDSTDPRVTLHKRKEGNLGYGWIVAVRVTYDKERLSIEEWLRENQWVWE